MALGRRGHGADIELVHHSDRGSQYTSIDYTRPLTDHGAEFEALHAPQSQPDSERIIFN